MVTDWDIAKTSLTCAECEREFAEEEKIFSALYDEPASIVRRDYCDACWQRQGADLIFSFWQTRIPRRDAPVRRFVDDEIVLDLFRRLDGRNDPQKRNFRYVLALLLMRKKALKFTEFRRSEDGDALVLCDRLNECEHIVADPHLSEEQIQKVTEEVGQILNVKV